MEHSKRAETDVGGNPADSPSNSTPPSCRVSFCHLPLRSRLLMIAILLSLGLLGWRFSADNVFWQDAWNQGTLFPTIAGRQLCEARGQSAQYAPRRQRFAFDLSAATVPADKILPGGPPKDGIPALSNPKFITPSEATYLQPEDRIIGLTASDQAKAYPLKILNYHEIVNDRVGDLPVAVTYCPLCDSCAVFDRRTKLGEREFGVSGLLYNSNVLMYDRSDQTESLWSQVLTQGVSGPGAKKSLTALPLELTTWGDWQSRHPNTLVLSAETGHDRNYSLSPYAKYFSTPRLMFPAEPSSDRLPAKSRVLGVWTETVAKAYPESNFSQDRQRVEDVLDGKKVVLEFNAATKSLRVVEADPGVQYMYSLWFAWHAFHPETEVLAQ